MGSRTWGVCPSGDSAAVQRRSTPPGSLGESQGTPGNMCQELITLRPGETGRQVVLRKVQELSDSNCCDPFMVADLDELVSRHQAFCKALPWVTPFYAVKCNNSPRVLRILAALGTGFDCASQGELAQVLGLGVAPSRIIFANPCKAISSIQYAAHHGVQLLTFDSEEELVKVAQYHPEARLVLRLWTQDTSSTFQLSSKFGARREKWEHLFKNARDLGLAVVGVSFHVGSDCQSAHAFTQAMEDSRHVLEMGHRMGYDISLLDVGGGFPGMEGSEPKFEEMASVINGCLSRDFPEQDGVTVIAEPGRFYAQSVFTAAVSIIAKKAELEPGGHRKFLYYLNEGHYGSFRILLRERLPRRPIVVKELSSDAPLFPCTLFGPTCDSMDLLSSEDVQLPELDVGDWLLFPSMGAYTSAMSSTFNGFLPASICYAVGPAVRSLMENTPGLASMDGGSRHVDGPPGSTVSPTNLAVISSSEDQRSLPVSSS